MKPKEADELLARMNRLLAKLDAIDLKKALGRPPLPPDQKCPCGEMSKNRAAKRNHVCEAKETKA